MNNISFFSFLQTEWRSIIFSYCTQVIIFSLTVSICIWIWYADVREYWLLFDKDMTNLAYYILAFHFFTFISWVFWLWQDWFYLQLEEHNAKTREKN